MYKIAYKRRDYFTKKQFVFGEHVAPELGKHIKKHVPNYVYVQDLAKTFSVFLDMLLHGNIPSKPTPKYFAAIFAIIPLAP